MSRDPRVLLTDIEQASADIESYIGAMTPEAYLADSRTQAAVERKFEIIGEALNRLHRDHPHLGHRIPQLRRIVDFRNATLRASWPRLYPAASGQPARPAGRLAFSLLSMRPIFPDPVMTPVLPENGRFHHFSSPVAKYDTPNYGSSAQPGDPSCRQAMLATSR